MVASVSTVSLFALAYVQIANEDHAHSPLAGWLLAFTLTATLGLTVQYWRRWFFFVPGYLGDALIAMATAGLVFSERFRLRRFSRFDVCYVWDEPSI